VKTNTKGLLFSITDVYVMADTDTWNDVGEPFDPTKADSVDEAVYIGQQVLGDTVVIGREDEGEWLTTTDMGPLNLAEYI